MKTLFAARLNQHPWHLAPSAGAELSVMADAGISWPDDFITPRQPMRALNGVAVINVCGVLAGGMPGFWEKVGNTDYQTLLAEIAAAKGNPAIKAVLQNVDSPGGNCVGCTEVYDAWADLAAVKPVIAYTRGMMCSAAYYGASAANFIYASKTAMVGCIGTIYTLFDWSKAVEQMGGKVIQVASGDLKGGGSMAGYTQAQLDDVKRIVDDYSAAFFSDVRKKRAISDDAMRGQWFKADVAPAGIVDFIGLPSLAAGDALAMAGGSSDFDGLEGWAALFAPAAKKEAV